MIEIFQKLTYDSILQNRNRKFLGAAHSFCVSFDFINANYEQRTPLGNAEKTFRKIGEINFL